MHSCLHTCVKYISGFRCPALLHPTFFFVHFLILFPFHPAFSFIYPIALSHWLLQLNGDGDTPLPLIGWNQARTSANHSHRSASLLITLTFHLPFFLFFLQEIKFRAAGMDSKQTNKKWRPTCSESAFPLTLQAKYNKELCVDVQVKGFVMCLAVCESGDTGLWVFAWDVCVLGAVSRAGGQEEEPGWANLWEDHPFLFFHSHLWMFFFFLCFSHSFISCLWNGVSVSTCCIPPFFYLQSFGAFTHSSSLFQSY